MRPLLTLLLSLTLLGCTGAIRARTPAEVLGIRNSSSNFRMELEEKANDEITDPCHYQLLLKNAILEERLKHCTPETPAPAPASIQIPLEVRVVPAAPEKPISSTDFPLPEMRRVSLMPVSCPPPPK